METRSLAAETTEEEEEEEEEGESWGLIPLQSWVPRIFPALYCPCTELAATPDGHSVGCGEGAGSFPRAPAVSEHCLHTIFQERHVDHLSSLHV